ncbi:MAG: hypothetical protein U0768_04025 [Anaerolineae bacterium]
MPAADALYHLQARDLRADGLRRRQRDIQAGLAEPASVLAARAAAQAAGERVETLRRNLRNADMDRQTVTGKIKNEETRLYSGRVTNVKEMTGIEHEIASLRRRLGQLDDQTLEMMFQLETAEAEQRAAAERLAHIEERWTAHQERLRGELGAVEAEMAGLTGEIEAARAGMLAAQLDVYDDLRRRKGGRAVARVIGGRCEGCQVTLPMVDIARARQMSLTYCSQCGRILLVDS